MGDGPFFGRLREREAGCIGTLVGWIVVISISTCALGARQPSESACSTPMWSAALIPKLEPGRTHRYWEGREDAGLAYLDNEHLIVHQVHVDFGQLSSRESADVSSPFRLQASLVDGSSGKPLLTREWGTRSGGSAIVVNHAGVIVRTGDTLRLLSSDLVELQKSPLQHDDAERLIDWEIQVSASRRSVLFNQYRVNEKNAGLSQYSVLDGETFEDREAWEEVPALRNAAFSVSDHAIAYVKRLHGRDQIVISEFGSKKWNAVWHRAGEGCNDSKVFAMVTGNSFVYACKELSFVANGKLQMREKFGKGEEPVNAKVSVAENGRVIAISLSRINVRLLNEDRTEYLSGLRVVVYDLVLKKRIQTVVISPLPKQYYDFALSPDGSKLAILNDRSVSVCEMPGQVSEAQLEPLAEQKD